jgi:peptide/nickel transport system substrate-binding protein
MKGPARAARSGLVTAAVVGAVAAVAAILAPGASARPAQQAAPAAGAHPCVVLTGSGDAAFTRSFNPYTGSVNNGQIMKGAIYEPLTISVVAKGGHVYPWLAKSWTWSRDKKTLNLQIQPNVKWSDGKPLTAADVVYSLTAGKQDKGHTMDIIGLYRANTNIASIKQVGPLGVAIALKTPDSQFIAANLNLQFVVPQHIWSKVNAPATFKNPNPVGSGPFTTITRLTTQDVVYGKNPNYWQPGKPAVSCLDYQEATSNDAALLQMQSGKVDWTHNFVANVESSYLAKDPAHFHAFYGTAAYPVSLMFDDTQYPYSLVAFRQAVSMSINRDDVSKLGEYGYAPATDALGLSYIFPSWVTDPAIKAQAKALATYNPDAAKKLLTDSGFTYSGSKLLDPKGNPVSFQVHVIAGWSDWVASLQIITKNLQAVGIDATVQTEPSWNDWYPSASSTKAPTLLWQNASQGSPYGFFFANLHQNALIASGQDATATGNWEHYSDPSATGLLNQWKTSLKPDVQHALATKVQAVWLKTLPVIPLFVGPRWSTYSTKYFHGFNSPKNFYGDPIFTTFPDNVLSFTRIAPGATTSP